MLLLQAQQVARHFGADILFENVNLDIKDNSKIALVGRNGAGKSTLIKMLIGESLPDEGKIVTKRDLTIGYLAQHTGLESTKNVLDEMLSVFEPLQKMEAKIHQLEEKIASPSIPHESKEYQQLLNQYDQLQHDFQENNGYGYENEVKAVLHGFQFFEEDYEKMVSDLSGGQRVYPEELVLGIDELRKADHGSLCGFEKGELVCYILLERKPFGKEVYV